MKEPTASGREFQMPEPAAEKVVFDRYISTWQKILSIPAF